MTDRWAPGAELRRSAAAHVLVETLSNGDPIPLTDEVEHHLRRVVRLSDGVAVSVTDGAGRWLITRVRHDRRGLQLEPSTDVALEARAPAIRLATAIPKGDRIDFLVQKATELGVEQLTLLHAQRSVVRWSSDRVQRQLARLRRISDEALRQSRRVWRMGIEGPVDSLQLLASAVIAEPGGRPLRAADGLVAVGPEGGWSDDELAIGSEMVDLGEAILRTETAAITAAVLGASQRR